MKIWFFWWFDKQSPYWFYSLLRISTLPNCLLGSSEIRTFNFGLGHHTMLPVKFLRLVFLKLCNFNVSSKLLAMMQFKNLQILIYFLRFWCWTRKLISTCALSNHHRASELFLTVIWCNCNTIVFQSWAIQKEISLKLSACNVKDHDLTFYRMSL